MGVELKLPPLNLTGPDWANMPLNERVLHIAAQEADVYHTAELPKYSNSGPRVDAMLRSARCAPGNPWCAAFVTWCCLHSGWDPYGEVPGSGVMYPASVVSWVAWAKRTLRLKSGSPQRGDLFFFDRAGETHIGFVSEVNDHDLGTIEGNTNCDGSADGYEVARRVRAIHSPTGFITLRDISRGGASSK